MIFEIHNTIDHGGDGVLRHPKHLSCVMSQVAQNRKDGIMCDVTIVVESKKFFAHKVILAANSDYFKAMFTGCLFIEAQKKEICINSITSDSFQELLKFFYEGELCISMHSVEDLLYAANMFLLNDIKSECFKFLSRNITTKNCIHIKNIAKSYSESSLLQKSTEFINQHFQEIILEGEVLKLNFNEILSLLKCNEISCETEDSVSALLEKWLRERDGIEVSKLRLLLKSVRLPFLSEVGRKQLNNFLKVLDTKFPEKRFSRLLSVEKKNQTRNLHRNLITRRTAQKLTSVFLYINKRGNSYCCKIGEKKLYSLERYLGNRMPASLTVHDNIVYASGGGRGVFSCAFTAYDIVKDKWSSLSPMAHERQYHCTAALDGKLYVIGGCNMDSLNNENSLQTVQCYDICTNTWSHAPGTIDARVSASATSSKRHVYVIGGRDRELLGSIQTAERYCPHEQCWELLPNMNEKRRSCFAVFCNDKVYAVGGSSTPSIEFYDDKQKKWTIVACPIPFPITKAFAINDIMLICFSTIWGNIDLFMYSSRTRRGHGVWTRLNEFCLPHHKSCKYAVVCTTNYHIDNNLCNSSFDDTSDDTSSSSSDEYNYLEYGSSNSDDLL